MNAMTVFNLRHAIISRSYYAKAVSFRIDHLAGAPLPVNGREARSHVMQGERSGLARQLHRTNRTNARAQRRVLVDDSELTPEQLRKRYKNFRYQAKLQKRRSPEFFRQAKAQLEIVWPTQES